MINLNLYLKSLRSIKVVQDHPKVLSRGRPKTQVLLFPHPGGEMSVPTTVLWHQGSEV